MRLNIIGRGRGSNKGLTADGERWCVNVYRPGADVMFAMHQPEIAQTAERIREARNAGLEVVTLSNYPLSKIIDHFQTKYFCNSISYMIALALYQKRFSEIDLWGCNIQAHSDEPMVKKHPGVEFWIGWARGLGVNVTVHGQSTLFELPGGKLYGYDQY